MGAFGKSTFSATLRVLVALECKPVVDLITPDNRHMYRDLLDDMFAMRYRVVVEKWGWQIPGVKQGYEKDQFDTDASVYLIETDAYRTRVTGCVRLNPTTQPHMMSELFAPYCDLVPPSTGPQIWECSRYVVDRQALASRDLDLPTRRRLSIGVTEFCLSEGISHLCWYTNQAVYNLILRIWETTPLGLPATYSDGDEVYIPALSKVDEAALTRQLAWLDDVASPVTYAYVPVSRLARAAPITQAA
jgi:N-acyl-L-homoserine lactone synthetase